MLDPQEKITYPKHVLRRLVSIGSDSCRDGECLQSLNQDGKQGLEVPDSFLRYSSGPKTSSMFTLSFSEVMFNNMPAKALQFSF